MHGFGIATKFGSLSRVDRPIVAGASTPTHHGLWLCGTDGGIFSFGDAHYHGSKVRTGAPVCAFARTTSGNGYWLTARDGMVAAFGDAPALGRVNADTALVVRA